MKQRASVTEASGNSSRFARPKSLEKNGETGRIIFVRNHSSGQTVDLPPVPEPGNLGLQRGPRRAGTTVVGQDTPIYHE